jgi:D-lactate dehydrogenase
MAPHNCGVHGARSSRPVAGARLWPKVARSVTSIDVLGRVPGEVRPTIPGRDAKNASCPSCSSVRSGSHDVLYVLTAAAVCGVRATVLGCCALEGDHGMQHPQLGASAAARQTTELRADGRTPRFVQPQMCEVGMSRADGTQSSHILTHLQQST